MVTAFGDRTSFQADGSHPPALVPYSKGFPLVPAVWGLVYQSLGEYAAKLAHLEDYTCTGTFLSTHTNWLFCTYASAHIRSLVRNFTFLTNTPLREGWLPNTMPAITLASAKWAFEKAANQLLHVSNNLEQYLPQADGEGPPA